MYIDDTMVLKKQLQVIGENFSAYPKELFLLGLKLAQSERDQDNQSGAYDILDLISKLHRKHYKPAAFKNKRASDIKEDYFDLDTDSHANHTHDTGFFL